MSLRVRVRALLAVGVCLGLVALADRASTASAAPFTIYSDETSFTSALSNRWANTFSGVPSGVRPNPSTFSGAGTVTGSFAYSGTASGGLYLWPAGTPGPALTTLAGNQNLFFTSFSSDVQGFGGRFWVADFNEGSVIPSRTVTLTLTFSDSTTGSTSALVSGTNTFLGIVVDPAATVTQARLSAPGFTGQTTAAGQVIVGTAVPEPSTLVIAAAAAAAFGWRACRRRRPGGG
jgi:hypothetical protein